MRRRQFLALVGSLATCCPAEVVAQKSDRMRRIGVLMAFTADDTVGLRRAKIFTQALQDLGWTDGQNTRIDYRWPGADIEQIQSLAKELVGSRPDVLVGVGSAPTAALQQATRTIPIVFLMAPDPVAEGIVQSLARPGGNATGFFGTEPSLGGKWLELRDRARSSAGCGHFQPGNLHRRHIVFAFGRDSRVLVLGRGDRRSGSPRWRHRTCDKLTCARAWGRADRATRCLHCIPPQTNH